MHKYQPRIHLVQLKPDHHHHHHHHSNDHQVQTPQLTTSSGETHGDLETLNDLDMTSDTVTTFVFTETMFTAVTAYQNQLVNLSTLVFIAFFLLQLYLMCQNDGSLYHHVCSLLVASLSSRHVRCFQQYRILAQHFLAIELLTCGIPIT